jgi:nucleoside-diphosphate-sugar epimerase
MTASRERVFITGAGGFLGSHICRHFWEKGSYVIGAGRFHFSAHERHPLRFVHEFHGLTLPDPSLPELLRLTHPDLLVHCAGSSSVGPSLGQPHIDFQKNVEVCASLLESIRQESPKTTFVLLSSAAVYGNPEQLPVTETAELHPLSPYGYHKRMCESVAEQYFALYGVRAAILRIFSAYGNGLKKQVLFDLCRKFSDVDVGQVEVLGTGRETRDFVHAADIAQAIDRIFESQQTGLFNVGSGNSTMINEVVQRIRQSFDSQKDILYTGSARLGDPLFWQADISRLTALGYRPRITLTDGLARYCQWFREWNRVENLSRHAA